MFLVINILVIMASVKQKINIEVISDVMCPWCWVGKRMLEAAIKVSQDKYDFEVTWHPYLLRPSMPREGVPRFSDKYVFSHVLYTVQYHYCCRELSQDSQGIDCRSMN